MGDHWEHEDETTVYFWGGVLSNWAKAPFMAPLRSGSPLLSFCCSEQYMMATKAVLFEDYPSFQAIMRTRNPKVQKAIGRSITGYDESVWNECARDRTYPGIYEKFRQDQKLLDLLVSTGDKTLVEASPFDRKWGIGYDHSTAPNNRSNWGWNWLGQMLMKAREDLRTGENSSFCPIDWTLFEHS